MRLRFHPVLMLGKVPIGLELLLVRVPMLLLDELVVRQLVMQIGARELLL